MSRIKGIISKKQWIVTAICAVAVLMFFLVYAQDYLNPTTPGIDASGITEEMTAGRTYTQTIKCDEDGLSFVRIRFEIYDRFNSSRTAVRLLENDTPIQIWEIENKKLVGFYTYHALKLDSPIKDSKSKTYVLEFTTDAMPGDGIGISEASYLDGGFCIDGMETGQTICYRLSYKLPIARLFSGAAGKHVIAVVILLVALLAMSVWAMNSKMERGFIVIWCIASAIMLTSSTVFNVPDEDFHFYRSYEIATGHMMTPVDSVHGTAGSYLPFATDFDLLESGWDSFHSNSNMAMTEELSYKNYYNTATYSPLSYLPQGIGIFFTRLITKNVAAMAYAGRLVNWAVITFLLIIAIRMLPAGKEVMAMLLLMPMNVQESVSLAPDGLVMAVAAVMIAYVMKLRHQQTSKLLPGQIVILYVLAIVISLIKIVYLPFVLLYFLIPSERFGGRLKKTIQAVGIAVAVIVFGGVWLILCTRYLVHQGSDSGVQLAYVLANPIRFIIAVFRTYFENGDLFLLQAVGASLAETNVASSGIVMLIYAAFVMVKIRPKLTVYSNKMPFQRIMISVMVGGMFILITMSLYLQWTYVYENSVQGLQGRYFMPLLLPVYFILNEGKPVDDQKPSPGAAGMMALANACAGISLLFSCISG